MSSRDDLERKLSELLEDGEMEQGDRTAKEIRQISPRYEVRIQTTFDPIVEETRRYRKLGRELDDRYDKYMERAGEPSGKPSPDGQGTERD
ncbi:hypothetical protein [Paenibacillus donghaensis]|uniref:Uncharacterized protein n=1 Tax=Paenibacillus donghaensis TaxID=414771 RepID=A0A2Z2KPA1_9BACL|nr:hypothetical protein [Paenibacillus donghaensis]ASA25550.1 hypothetical protein B9T62_35355 [Paenibacillus donghaensis]